jgi:hypothetical protein
MMQKSNLVASTHQTFYEEYWTFARKRCIDFVVWR